jgi:hypothetical protein
MAQLNICTSVERSLFALTGARSATSSNSLAASWRVIDAAGSLPQTSRAFRSKPSSFFHEDFDRLAYFAR